MVQMARGSRSGLRLVASLLLLGCIVLTSAQSLPAINITAILEPFPDFSLLSQLLIQTGVANEINSRQSLTLLAPSNEVLSGFQSTLSQSDVVAVADLARLHVLLQYFDIGELKALPFDNYTSVTTLLQSTGRVAGSDGFVNIYNSPTSILVGDAAQDPSSPNATVITNITQFPSSISVIQIDRVLTPVGFSSGGADIIQSLESFHDFTQFISLLNETGVTGIFQGRQSQGITIFAPTDAAFNAIADGSLQNYSADQKKLLAQYHGLTSYYTLSNLQSFVDVAVQTIASTIKGGFLLNATSAATVVTLLTGVDNATLTSTVFDARPVSIFAIDAVLIPKDFVGASPAPVTTPVPVPGPGPAPKRLPAPGSTPAPALGSEPAPGPGHLPGSAATVAQISGAISLAVTLATSVFAVL